MNNCPLCSSSLLKPKNSDHGRNYFECERCGLISLDPKLRLKPEAEEARYRLHNNSPEDLRYRDFLNQALNPLQAKLQAGMRGLDYGCGPNPTTSVILSEQGFLVENYDPFFFPNEISLSASYDFICCTETIEHMFNPASEFETLDRVLSPSGWLILMTGVYDESTPFESWWYLKDPTHVSFYQPQTFDWLAQKYAWTMYQPSKNVRLFQKG